MLNIAIKIVVFVFLFVGSVNAQNTWPRDKYTGLGGGLYTRPGGGLYTRTSENSYKSNQPPRRYLLKYLKENNMESILELLKSVGF